MAGTQGAQSGKAKHETQAERRMRLIKEQVVRELGLWDRLLTDGWGGLSARESGRVGGIVARRMREEGSALTPSQVPLQAVLFTKSDCSLCVKAESVLARVARDVPLEVRVVKIPMSDRRADRVPIVEIGGVEVQSQKVSEFRLRNWLKERGFRNATR